MDAQFDINSLMNAAINARLLNDKNTKPVVKVMNKYGVFGLDCLAFMTELAVAAQIVQGEKQGAEQ